LFVFIEHVPLWLELTFVDIILRFFVPLHSPLEEEGDKAVPQNKGHETAAHLQKGRGFA
jgi:hypothetical protein